MNLEKRNKKVNKVLVVVASILIIIPFHIDSYNDIIGLISYIPTIIGYILLLTQYKLFNEKQKKIFKMIIGIFFINILVTLWIIYINFNDAWKTHTMSDMGKYIFPSLIMYLVYFSQRILHIFLAVEVLKKEKN